MSTTTIERPTFTTTATSNDPFGSALADAAERERKAAEAAARRAEAQRIEREQRRQAEMARQARITAEKRIKWARDYFLTPIAETAKKKGWKVDAILQVQAYSEALVHINDGAELPFIYDGMGKIIRSRFVFAIAMDSIVHKLIPGEFFVGQRQEWFQEAFDLKVADILKQRARQQ
ncbi:MAG: hypothetical protein ACOH18_01680 [Candidatus Saccharimonadaceae bacterium]